ncbi:FtsB family cell division protein [Rossellomorea aquimaris]|uniref:FtsB family cell division protein n=1 Tax=Rossellomorea aquimaris TaxID=189382 RepID=UPI0007D07860|nr:septum formation initiator family protein [Rossellomorea aquimaris]
MRKNVTSMENEYVRHQEHIHHSSSKRKKRLVRRLSLFFVLVLAISGFLVSTLISRTQVLEDKRAEKAQLEKKLEHLKDKQSALEEEIVKLNDDEYIAKLARRDYFLSDDGEIIFNIPEPDKEKEEEVSY